VATFDLGNNVQPCAYKDPATDWESVAKQYNRGKCNGWLQAQPSDDHFPIGYYTEAQVPVLGSLARNFTLFDHYFSSLMASTWPTRLYQLCAATDLDQTGEYPAPDAPRPSQLQLAIFDRLQAAHLSSAYYTWGEPMTGLFESRKYDSLTFPKDKFFADADA